MRDGDRLAAASAGGLGGLILSAYVLGWLGVPLMPWVVAALGGLAAMLAAWAITPTAEPHRWRIAGPGRIAALATATGLFWQARPRPLPPGGGADLAHHLALVDVLARTRLLVDGDPSVGLLGEMAHYTPGLHLAIVALGDLAAVPPWRAAQPLVLLTVALKAGVVAAIARRALAGVGAASAWALAAVALVLFMPRAYSTGAFLQSGYLPQVAAELFAAAGWWMLMRWFDRPTRGHAALVGLCAAVTFLIWPIWVGPVMAATAVVMLAPGDGRWPRGAGHLLLASTPLALVCLMHLSRHAAWLRMAGTTGAVPAFVPDGPLAALVVSAAVGVVFAWRAPAMRVTLVVAASLALQAAALYVLARRGGAETPYMSIKMTYLATYPLAVCAAFGLARACAAVRLPPALSGLVAAGVVAFGLGLAAAVRPPPPIVSPDLDAAGRWARQHLPADDIDYLVAQADTAYWLHLAVLGQPRASARLAELDRHNVNLAVGRWLEGTGRPHAIAERGNVPAELTALVDTLFESGDALVIRRRPSFAERMR